MSLIRKINPILREKYEQELQMLKTQGYDTMRNKFQKKKVSMLTLCTKKDLHFILNSLLQGDVFEQDILNQFWETNFRQTATVGEIVKVYNNSMILILQKILENNIIIHQISKERQKHKQDHNFKQLNLSSQELQNLHLQTSQLISDLEELTKPFHIHLQPIISKYKPLRIKDKINTLQQDPKTDQPNVFLQLQEQAKQQEEAIQEQLTTEQKYYHFFLYLTFFVTLCDLSLSFSKYNFIDLISNLLLLLNSLLQNYLFKQETQGQTYEFVLINYEQNKIGFNDVLSLPLHLKTMSQDNSNFHSFQKYSYSSFCLLSVSLFMDLLWILIMRNSYLDMKGATDGSLFGGSMWRYNHYVVYVSYISAGTKGVMLFLLTRTVLFEWKKLVSKFNFYMNFIRFTTSSYINQLINSTI